MQLESLVKLVKIVRIMRSDDVADELALVLLSKNTINQVADPRTLSRYSETKCCCCEAKKSYFRVWRHCRLRKRRTFHRVRAISYDWGQGQTISLLSFTCQKYHRKGNVSESRFLYWGTSAFAYSLRVCLCRWCFHHDENQKGFMSLWKNKIKVFR